MSDAMTSRAALQGFLESPAYAGDFKDLPERDDEVLVDQFFIPREEREALKNKDTLVPNSADYLGRFQEKPSLCVDLDLDANKRITSFGMDILSSNYLLAGETPQHMFARVASYYGNDEAHAQRLYGYMSKLWFMPATPILSNGGTQRGLPISCFLSSVGDSLPSIADTWYEQIWLASKGGGIGTYWGDVRENGSSVNMNGQTSGIIPFIKVQEALTVAISQGSLRRGSAAVYLPVWHPEIEEFIDLRKDTGGDPMRKTKHLHNAVVIDDAFMKAVEDGTPYNLISPRDGKVIRTVDAREIWIRILTTRVARGEPYLLFIDTVNDNLSNVTKRVGLKVKQSNLCSEITLPTGLDYQSRDRTAVCCLSSLNLDKYDEWKDEEGFVKDVLYMLDNVLQDFIDRADPTFDAAKYSAAMERSIGLGVMGLHSYLQRKGLGFEDMMAHSFNKSIFKSIKSACDKANVEIGKERGACPDAQKANLVRRFSNCTAVAPTASISNICGGVSPGIEPRLSNAYSQRTRSGSLNIINPVLKEHLEKIGFDTEDVWNSIVAADGSVQHLDCLDEDAKRVFRTSFEVDQMSIIKMAGDRAKFIDQAQSVNLFLLPNINKIELHKLHFHAWKLGVKSLYYCRSMSVGKTEHVSQKVEKNLRHVVGEGPAFAMGAAAALSTSDILNSDDDCTFCQ